MSDFHFVRPYLLFLLIPFFILAIMLLRGNRSTSLWNHICSNDLMPYVLVKKTKRRNISSLFILFTLALLITALAGPSWQTISQPLIKPLSGLVIALDLSPSMNAEDIKPSRLQRAIYKLNDILNLRKEGQTALVVFSGDPFTVTPLTDDVATIKALLPALETKIMPSSGHSVHKAITKAIELLNQSGLSNGSILLITAQLSTHEKEKIIEIAKQNGITISVLAVATEDAIPIPNAQGGFLTDDKGALVVTTLSKENLTQLAKSTHGAYATISIDDSDINYLSKNFSTNDLTTAKEDLELKQNKWHDQGYLLVLFALPFVSLIFRRGLLAMMLFFLPYPIQAISWNDLWKTSDQQAEQLFHQEEYQQAKELFQHPDWQAATHYKLGDYENAAKLFQNDSSAEGFFNYGTAKAKQGDFKGALAAYQKSLEINPNHEDAQYNKKLIEGFLQKEKQKKQDKKNQNSDKQQDQEQDQQQNQEQNQDSQEQQNEDQKEGTENQDKNKNENDKQKSQKQDDNQDSKQEQSSNDQRDASELNEEQKKELQEHYRDKVEEELKEKEEKLAAAQLAQEELSEEDEDPQRQIDDRWLQRIQDDPGGLLRRKFLQQYQQQNRTFKK